MSSLLLTWKDSGWPHSNIVRMVERFQADGHVDEPWRIIAHKIAQPGDRVWLLKQGRGPKGIFGVGEITGRPELGAAGNGKTQWMAPVQFEAFVDPLERLLIGEEDLAGILQPGQIRAQASGYPISDDQSAALQAILDRGTVVELAGSGDWTPSELQAIVADYLSMLQHEQAGQSYSKADHRKALLRTVHRSAGSIERKHQNISGVLRELGLPWIIGYKPLGNFQDALVDAVEAGLDRGHQFLGEAPAPTIRIAVPITEVFVPPPPARETQPRGRSIERVVRKWDPAIRDAANRSLGMAGEEFVLGIERDRLIAAGRSDLAEKVRWTSRDDGDGLGYDIASFALDSSPIFIEVKTTRGSIETPFFLTENERLTAARLGPKYRLYRVFGLGSDPRIFELRGPLDSQLLLEPTMFRATCHISAGPRPITAIDSEVDLPLSSAKSES